MFEVIHWRGYLRVDKKAGAERVIARMGRAAGEPFTLLSCERYWKNPELAEVRMTSPLGVPEPRQAVFHALLTAQRIASPWSVTCRGAGDGLTFEGIAAKTADAHFTVPGVDWLLFSVTAGEPARRTERKQPAFGDRVRVKDAPEELHRLIGREGTVVGVAGGDKEPVYVLGFDDLPNVYQFTLSQLAPVR